ncbi:LysR family transcriptional regulator [Aquincola sp. S2]|uniref:LysR family transcriptional regulator n=1 Tax=Pseudaquabacterium terrae TaxID=2732868 RepID=A0ABX2EUJ5_9BURK|nr:LysR substrate-binding domain-containing protein [Aquabacterium terrae]NRF72131.1 LysR family transcriptional regulator [Aquabacterium terrae]
MKLPPLHALRMFDAVARLGGIRAAAETLFVTPAAVTQQVKQLERSLGVPLLQRQGRSVVLTEAGRQLHLGTTRHLHAIAEAAEQVRPREQRVRITTVASFAVRWLVPRLQRFMDRCPDVDVQVDADHRLLDLGSGDWDLAIREGQGRYPGTEAERLFGLEVVPVCAPAYAKRHFKQGPARGWPRARLLHEVGHPWWPGWLERAGVAGIDTGSGLHFSHTVMVIAAALDGQGVALVPPPFIQDELAEGRLCVLDAQPYETGVGMYVVWPAGRGPGLSAEALQFRDWVLAEARGATAPVRRTARAPAAIPADRTPRAATTAAAARRSPR